LTIARSEIRTHWLAALASGAGLVPPGEVIEVALGTPLPEAWAQVARPCGLSEEMEAQLMEEGADDYIRKPLEPARFVARVKAALRRAGD
jgi:hypothetical protein